jgi:hypothetical protein
MLQDAFKHLHLEKKRITAQSMINWIEPACGHSYGNLMRVMTDCIKAGIMGSPGKYGWLGAYFCNCPNEDVTILFMMQISDLSGIEYSVLALCFRQMDDNKLMGAV